jgi:hypothetical protein
VSEGKESVLRYGWKIISGAGAGVDVEWERSFPRVDLKVNLVGLSLQSSWEDKDVVE